MVKKKRISEKDYFKILSKKNYKYNFKGGGGQCCSNPKTHHETRQTSQARQVEQSSTEDRQPRQVEQSTKNRRLKRLEEMKKKRNKMRNDYDNCWNLLYNRTQPDILPRELTYKEYSSAKAKISKILSQYNDGQHENLEKLYNYVSYMEITKMHKDYENCWNLLYNRTHPDMLPRELTSNQYSWAKNKIKSILSTYNKGEHRNLEQLYDYAKNKEILYQKKEKLNAKQNSAEKLLNIAEQEPKSVLYQNVVEFLQHSGIINNKNLPIDKQKQIFELYDYAYEMKVLLEIKTNSDNFLKEAMRTNNDTLYNEALKGFNSILKQQSHCKHKFNNLHTNDTQLFILFDTVMKIKHTLKKMKKGKKIHQMARKQDDKKKMIQSMRIFKEVYEDLLSYADKQNLKEIHSYATKTLNTINKLIRENVNRNRVNGKKKPHSEKKQTLENENENETLRNNSFHLPYMVMKLKKDSVMQNEKDKILIILTTVNYQENETKIIIMLKTRYMLIDFMKICLFTHNIGAI